MPVGAEASFEAGAMNSFLSISFFHCLYTDRHLEREGGELREIN
jgi:hypothetical protein